MWKIVKRIPFAEAIISFLGQVGLWQYVLAAFAALGAGLMVFWSYITSALPLWIIVIIGVGVFLLLILIADRIQAMFLRRRQAEIFDKVVKIDRDALADELETLSREVSALATEHRGDIQEAWWGDARNHDGSRSAHVRAEGKLIEKFGMKYQARAFMLIRRASKVVQIDRSAHWRIEHGVRSEMDLVTLSVFLAQISDDVRNPVAPIPMYDHQRVPKVVDQ